MKAIAGVDCHKGTHTIVVLDVVGKLLVELKIGADCAGYGEAIKLGLSYPEIIWGLEGTGTYGRGLAEALVAAGMTVFEVPGSITKRHRRSGSRHGKSDAVDARAIAEAVLREADRLPRFRDSAEREALRLRYDQRDRLVRERTVLINRLRSSALRLALKGVPADMTTRISAQKLIALVGDAPDDPVEEALIDEMHFNVETLDRLNDRIARLERVMRPFVRALAPELLDLHGVSTVVAAGLIGHAGDMRNFRNADAFAMHNATAPIPWSSGSTHSVRVNLGGNRQLNRLLHMVALCQARTVSHPGRAFFDRKRSEGKASRAALRALKRRLSTVVFYRLQLCQRRLEERTLGNVA